MTLHFVIKSNFVALKIVIDYDDANIQSTVYICLNSNIGWTPFLLN